MLKKHKHKNKYRLKVRKIKDTLCYLITSDNAALIHYSIKLLCKSRMALQIPDNQKVFRCQPIIKHAGYM